LCLGLRDAVCRWLHRFLLRNLLRRLQYRLHHDLRGYLCRRLRR